jgi:AcrR family transcriptional regulator
MSTTKERLIEAALKRFYRDGFRNVGIEPILNDVGISKTAFYKHFASKDDLMTAVLNERSTWLQATLRTLVRERGGDDPVAQLRALFDVVEAATDSNDFQCCIFMKAAMEFPQLHDPAHLAAAQNRESVVGIISEIAAQAGAAEPAVLACELELVMEGAYATRLLTGNSQSMEAGRRVAEGIIQRHCGVASEVVR